MSLVEHHIKYKEIHGEDKTTFIPKSDHQKLHRRLRKEGKCNIPSEELQRIARNAANRTAKYRQTDERRSNTPKRKEYIKKRQSVRTKESRQLEWIRRKSRVTVAKMNINDSLMLLSDIIDEFGSKDTISIQTTRLNDIKLKLAFASETLCAVNRRKLKYVPKELQGKHKERTIQALTDAIKRIQEEP